MSKENSQTILDSINVLQDQTHQEVFRNILSNEYMNGTWIARRLDVPESKINNSLEVLESSGLIQSDKNNFYLVTEKGVSILQIID